VNRHVRQLEKDLMNHQLLKVLREAGNLLAKGLENSDLHLLAGMAAEEVGSPERARAHLARAEQLNPAAFLARTALGRAYWRYGWFALALALWRSLPVEGPYDHGRHYHLALGHDALGDRPAALLAMRVALNQFYPDTYHFYIQRALWHWQEREAAG
jgi:tetratricopeptide (TPR) repeat protein